MSASSSGRIGQILSLLPARVSPGEWWPGSPEEILIGAILTQQTRWESVERALALLREAGCCSLQGVHRLDLEELEELIRCTGFFRQKAARLKGVTGHVLSAYGGLHGMEPRTTGDLRRDLLSLRGIGEETADTILCYALGRPAFVVDAYTERICRCAGVDTPRKDLKAAFEAVLPPDVAMYREVHARFVDFGKRWCTGKRCGECRIRMHGG